MQKLLDGIFRFVAFLFRDGKVLNVNEPKKQGSAAPVPD